MKQNIVPIKKTDKYQQIVYGEVYTPDVPDSDGDFMTKETICKAAHNFMKKLRLSNIDVNHDGEIIKASVVESYIAQEGDPIFIPGSWVAGVHIADDDAWDKVLKGELNGFSLEGLAVSTETELELTIPEFVDGTTDEFEGHSHKFVVKFDAEGGFLGGHTSKDEDHQHTIVRGTATESALDHTHRFAFIEAFYE